MTFTLHSSVSLAPAVECQMFEEVVKTKTV